MTVCSGIENFMRDKPGFVAHGWVAPDAVTQIQVGNAQRLRQLDFPENRKSTRSAVSPGGVMIEVNAGNPPGEDVHQSDPDEPRILVICDLMPEVAGAHDEGFEIFPGRYGVVRPSATMMHVLVICIVELQMFATDPGLLENCSDFQVSGYTTALTFGGSKTVHDDTKAAAFSTVFACGAKEGDAEPTPSPDHKPSTGFGCRTCDEAVFQRGDFFGKIGARPPGLRHTAELEVLLT